MEETYKVGPKNVRKNFRIEELIRHKLFFVISRCKKCLVMSTPKPNNYIELF